ncbi:MAG: acyl-CoA carboxylase subunit beta [Dehalococcoidia bacterium]
MTTESRNTTGTSGWEPELEQLQRRRELVLRMGGEEGVARQHSQGKLTVRERLEKFADPGSLREFMSLMGVGQYADGELEAFTPRASVEGFCKVEGRKVVVTGGDFTVRGGSGGGSHGGLGMEMSASRRALEWRVPYIRLLDAAGGSVRSFEEIGRTYLPDGNSFTLPDVRLLRAVPVVSAVMGSVAGLPAVNACVAHFNVMVKGTSQLFPGGPPVVKAALGYDITKEELGGSEMHTTVSGVIDNLAESEDEAIAMVRRFLGYLPSSVWEMAPRKETGDDPARREDRLLKIKSRDPRRAYDARQLITAIVDIDSFFEIAPRYGRARTTGLARLNGYPVGIMANNPMYGAATDVAAGEKVMRLVQLCDTFHLPIIDLADEPGFMVGLDSERAGIERAGARVVITTCDSQMPWATIVVGQLYGVAGQCHHRPTGMFQRYAWPSANWGSMHIEGGTTAAYRREIESSPDPEAKRAEIEKRLKDIASPFRTAEATGQDIIDPRDTRRLLCEFVEEAQPILRTQLGQTAVPYRP